MEPKLRPCSKKTMRPECIAAVVFDLDNTLVDRERAHALWVEEVLVQNGEGIDEELKPALKEEMIRKDLRGYCGRREYCRWVAEILPGADRNELHENYGSRIVENLSRFDETVSILESLGTRRKLGLLSNGSTERQMAKLERTGLRSHFDAIVIPEEIGASKPSEKAFHEIIKRLSVPAEHALFVGDDLERDIRGANDCGLYTCWMRNGQKSDPHEFKPDFIIDRLDGLRRVLPC